MANYRFDVPLSVFIIYRASSLPESVRGSSIPLKTYSQVPPELLRYSLDELRNPLGFLTVCHHQPPRSGSSDSLP